LPMACTAPRLMHLITASQRLAAYRTQYYTRQDRHSIVLCSLAPGSSTLLSPLPQHVRSLGCPSAHLSPSLCHVLTRQTNMSKDARSHHSLWPSLVRSHTRPTTCPPSSLIGPVPDPFQFFNQARPSPLAHSTISAPHVHNTASRAQDLLAQQHCHCRRSQRAVRAPSARDALQLPELRAQLLCVHSVPELARLAYSPDAVQMQRQAASATTCCSTSLWFMQGRSR